MNSFSSLLSCSASHLSVAAKPLTKKAGSICEATGHENHTRESLQKAAKGL